MAEVAGLPRKFVVGRGVGLNVYLLALALACLLPILAISGFAMWRAGEAYRETATTRLSDTAATLARAIEADIEGRFTALTTFATLRTFSGDTVSTTLTSSRFKGIGLDGRITLVAFDGDTPIGTVDRRIAAVAHEAASKQAPALSNLYLGRKRTDFRIDLALPLRAEASRMRALVLSVAPEQLIRALQQKNQALSGILVAVTDGNGRIIARSRDAERTIGLRAPDWHKLEALNARSGWFEGMTTEKMKTILAFEKLDGTPGWALVVGEPTAVFNARWKDPLIGLSFGALVALGLATVAAVWIGRLILRPIEALAAHSAAVASDHPADALPPIPKSLVREFETLRVSVEAAEAARRNNERRLETVAQAGALALWRWSARGDLSWIEGWSVLTGTAESDALGLGWLDHVHPEDRARLIETLEETRAACRMVDVEFRLRVADGRWLWVRKRGGPVQDDNGAVLQWAGVIEDIDARKQSETHVAHLAHHDALTDLANRVTLRQRLDDAIADTLNGKQCALLYLDLDRFKQVNDTLGHAAGDTLLCVVADRLRACVGEHGLVARLGGDEFAILQDDADREEKGLALAERIIEIVSAPYLIDGFSATVGVSVGITFISDSASDAGACLKRADQALYWAKQAGRGRAVIYEQEESLARLASFAGLPAKRLQA